MKTISPAKALKFSGVAGVPESMSLTKAQKEELDRRLEEYRKNAQAGSPWSEVKKRIQASR